MSKEFKGYMRDEPDTKFAILFLIKFAEGGNYVNSYLKHPF